jgi:hypothetical protein
MVLFASAPGSASRNQLQHGFTVVLPEHFFPVPSNAAETDSEALRDFPISMAAHEKLHDLPAAWRKSYGRRISRCGNIHRKQQFAGCMHVKHLS